MNLRRLSHALMLQQEGSFARASQRLHITQTALTKSIQTLEGELGVRLFDRDSGGVHATAAGELVLAQAQQLVQMASGLERNVALIRDAHRGVVNFAVGPILSDALPSVLAYIADHHPHFVVRVEVEPPHQLLERLLNKKIEFFFGDSRQIGASPLIVKRHVATLPMGYFVRAEHPLLALPALTLDALKGYPLVGPAYLEARVLEGEGFALHQAGTIESAHFAGWISGENTWVMKQAALQSNAVLLASNLSVAADCQAGLLRQLDIESGPVDARVQVAHLAEQTLSPAAERLIGLIEKVLQT